MRILLLLITLTFNALYPATGLGSMCTSEPADNAKTSTSNTQQAIQNTNNPCNHDDMSNKGMAMSCDCCNDTLDSLNTNVSTSNCDSGCCVDSVTSSIPLSTFALIPNTHPISLKPVLAPISVYTRHISPELQPPLV